jgi:phospholipase D1/2
VSEERSSSRISRGTLLRFLVLPVLVICGFVAWRWTPLGHWLTADRLTATISSLQHAWWSPFLLFAAYLVLSPLGAPATPLMVAGGVVFGEIYGGIYNWIGVYAGGILTYYLGRFFGRDFVSQVGGKRLKKVERAIAQKGFWGLVAIRFLPLPYAIINYSEALTGIRPSLFLLTTGLGTAPTVFVYSYFFGVMAKVGVEHRGEIMGRLFTSMAILLLLIAIPQVWQGRRRRQRYENLRAQRAARIAVG